MMPRMLFPRGGSPASVESTYKDFLELPSDEQFGGARYTKDKRVLEGKYTYKELKAKLAEYNITGRSKLTTKMQMADAIREHHAMVGENVRRRKGRA